MTSQQQLICDQSTFANFAQWASAISAFFAAAGWLQSTDTGQVMWSGMTLTTVAMSGTNATYTYTSLTGLALAIGRTVTIAGMTNPANSGTFRITALGSGTFTVVNAAGINESSSVGTVTKATAVPGSGLFVYEVWQPGDGLTNFYTKVEYGNISGTNCPSLRFSLATSTNGAGTVAGFSFGPVSTDGNAFTAPSATIPYECNFSGDSGRIGAMLWRNGINSCQQLFAIERSVNSSGTATGSYVTLWTCGLCNSGNTNAFYSQRSLVFSAGPAPNLPANSSIYGGWALRIVSSTSNGVGNSAAFNGSIPMDTAAPLVGYFDYPCTMVGGLCPGDFAEGVPFTVTLYGATRTYIPSKIQNFSVNPDNSGQAWAALCMRYD